MLPLAPAASEVNYAGSVAARLLADFALRVERQIAGDPVMPEFPGSGVVLPYPRHGIGPLMVRRGIGSLMVWNELVSFDVRVGFDVRCFRFDFWIWGIRPLFLWLVGVMWQAPIPGPKIFSKTLNQLLILLVTLSVKGTYFLLNSRQNMLNTLYE
jgi:hypothetical protein